MNEVTSTTSTDLPRLLGQADEVESNVLEIVFEDETDAMGCRDVLMRFAKADKRLAIELVEAFSDDEAIHWLVRVVVRDDLTKGFVAGLMTGWLIAAEGG